MYNSKRGERGEGRGQRVPGGHIGFQKGSWSRSGAEERRGSDGETHDIMVTLSSAQWGLLRRGEERVWRSVLDDISESASSESLMPIMNNY